LLWGIFGEQIVQNIKNKTFKCEFPVKDIKGKDYWNEKYSLKFFDVSDYFDLDLSIDDLGDDLL
jgi:hypothetical protein